MKSVVIPNGERIAYREQGEGELFVLVHGNMTSSQHFDRLLAALDKDKHVIAVDLRGFGGSSYNSPVTHMKDFSDDIKSLMDLLGHESYKMLGWSTGGGVVMQHAIDYPESVKGLFLVESVGISGYPIFKKDEMGQPIIGNFLKSKEELAEDMVQVVPILNAYKNRDKAFLKAVWDAGIYNNNQPDEAQYDIYLEDMMTQKNLIDVDYALMTFNISDHFNGVVEGTSEVHKIKTPTVVYQGSNDLIVPIQMGQGIHDAIKESKYILHDGGHSPFIDDLDQIVMHINSFLSE
jgi:pimeloyl-ACP methyl ester carboxylesterase